MNIWTKIRLFQIHIRPLILHGFESLTLNADEMNMVKRIEGMVVKRIIGISKYCHSKLIYNALKMQLCHAHYKKMRMTQLVYCSTSSY